MLRGVHVLVGAHGVPLLNMFHDGNSHVVGVHPDQLFAADSGPIPSGEGEALVHDVYHVSHFRRAALIDSHRLVPGLALTVMLAGCSLISSPEPTTAPTGSKRSPAATRTPQPSEEEVRAFEGDDGPREAAGQVETLVISRTTRVRALAAYRRSPGADLSPDLKVGGGFYGKIFGKTAASDVYYLISSIGYNGRPVVKGQHLWTRTGNSPWRYLGDRRGRMCVTKALYDFWGLRFASGIYGRKYSDQHCPDGRAE